jgi:hypothetical protein
VELARQWRHYEHRLRPYYRHRHGRTPWQRFSSLVENTTGRAITQCSDCADALYESDLYTEDNGSIRVCGACFNNYSYCDDCGIYYHDEDDVADHGHDEDDDDSAGGACEVPRALQTFEIALPDGTALVSDARRTITLEPTIDPVARQQIYSVLSSAIPHRELPYWEVTPMQLNERDAWYDAALEWYRALTAEPVWQTPAGNLTKRLRKFYLQRELKLPDKLVENVGNIARAAMARSTTVDLVLSRRLNGTADEYNNDGSCWWGSYSSSRCVLKQYGGMALLLYRDDELIGRAWVMPLKRDDSRWVPSPDVKEATAYVVFNVYVNDAIVPARLLAELLGHEHKDVYLSIGPMYVNNDRGRLVASRDILDATSEIEMNLRPDCNCPYRNG